MNKIIAHIDGASRGNPGPSAIGVSIQINDNLKDYGEYLGEGTNNEAEYQSLIFALKKVKSLAGKDNVRSSTVEIFTDSELLAKQMNGEFKVKDEKIQRLFLQAYNLRTEFGDVVIKSVPREENNRADGLANEALDGELAQGRLV